MHAKRQLALHATLALATSPAASTALADLGLLLVAHGSPSPEWNKPVLDFGRKIGDDIQKDKRFRAVRTALLESAGPDNPGCDRRVGIVRADHCRSAVA
jgi:hypothetical protein